MKLSNALAATQTSLLASQLAGGFIRIFTGIAPARPDMAETGTLLGEVSVSAVEDAGLHFVASNAVLAKANEPWVFKALATGTAGWFRLVPPGDTGAADLDALRLDGTVGTPAVPGDMNWTDLAVTSGFHYTIDDFVYVIQPL